AAAGDDRRRGLTTVLQLVVDGGPLFGLRGRGGCAGQVTDRAVDRWHRAILSWGPVVAGRAGCRCRCSPLTTPAGCHRFYPGPLCDMAQNLAQLSNRPAADVWAI